MTVTFARFDSLEWTTPDLPPDLPVELQARARAVRRKGLASGDAGFFASHVAMDPGNVTVPHRHDHPELMVIIEGSMRFDAGDESVELRQHDAVTVSAGQVYGFEVGGDGVRFLLVRGAKATSTLV